MAYEVKAHEVPAKERIEFPSQKEPNVRYQFNPKAGWRMHYTTEPTGLTQMTKTKLSDYDGSRLYAVRGPSGRRVFVVSPLPAERIAKKLKEKDFNRMDYDATAGKDWDWV